MLHLIKDLAYLEYSGLLLPLCIIYTIVVFATKGFNKKGNANDILRMCEPIVCVASYYLFITSVFIIPTIYEILRSFFAYSIVIVVAALIFGFLLGLIIYKIWYRKHRDFTLTKEFEELYVIKKNNKKSNTYFKICIITAMSLVVITACFILSFITTYQVYSQGLYLK